jgi:hypothetical protein
MGWGIWGEVRGHLTPLPWRLGCTDPGRRRTLPFHGGWARRSGATSDSPSMDDADTSILEISSRREWTITTAERADDWGAQIQGGRGDSRDSPSMWYIVVHGSPGQTRADPGADVARAHRSMDSRWWAWTAGSRGIRVGESGDGGERGEWGRERQGGDVLHQVWTSTL